MSDGSGAAPASRAPHPRERLRATVAIPAIGRPARLEACIDAVRSVAEHDGVDIDLVVVLDGADDDVCEFARTELDSATVVSWPERRGFAAGINAALRICGHDVVLLQDDAVPQPGWLSSLLAAAREHPRSGIIGSMVLDQDHGLLFAGAVIGGNGLTSAPWIGAAPPPSSFAAPRSVDYTSSASMLISHDAWVDVGGFDEELYPAIYVDADFCTASWHAGWLVLVEPRSTVVHARFGSTTRPFREFVYARNRVRFMEKWGQFLAGRPPIPGTEAEMDAAVARAARWLTDPPRAAHRRVGAPIESAPTVYVERERDLLREYVAALEATLAAAVGPAATDS